MEENNVVLPVFKYFPDPLGAGSFVVSPAVCVCCNQGRGYIYDRNPFADGDYESKICPWCIHDGSAADLIDGVFSTSLGLGGELEQWDAVSKAVEEEITKRTPGFDTLQNDQWYTHCEDAAEFLGSVSKESLEEMGQGVVRDFIEALGEETYEEYLEFGSTELLDLMEEGSHGQGYLFRCLHCGKHGGFMDFT